MQELKKISVLSAAKISIMFGLVAGLLMSLYLWALYTYTPADLLAQMGVQAGVFGWQMFLSVVLLQVAVYFLVAVIGAALYNLFAKMVGGVKFNLVEAQVKKKK